MSCGFVSAFVDRIIERWRRASDAVQDVEFVPGETSTYGAGFSNLHVSKEALDMSSAVVVLPKFVVVVYGCVVS